MAYVSAQKARAAIGLLNASGYTESFNVAWESMVLDVSTLADAAKAFIVGQQSASAAFTMFLDTSAAANGQFDVLHDWKSSTPSPVSFAPEGFAATGLVVLVDAIETNATTSAAVADVVKAAVAAISTGAIDVGVAIEDFRAVTADGNGASVNNGASTANGGVAHLHVTAFSGLTSDVILLEHSTDDSIFTTLGTFTTVTGLTSQRLTIAAGTTVNQYLRLTDDVTGTGSITRSVSFARR
jgi:hypothetical protein